MAKLDKIKFAQLISWISYQTRYTFDCDQIAAIDQAIDISDQKNVVPFQAVDELLDTIRRDDGFIPAIKVYRALTGVGLKEAKEAIERYRVVNKSLGKIVSDAINS